MNSFDKSYTFGANNYGIRVLHLDTTINYVNGGNTVAKTLIFKAASTAEFVNNKAVDINVIARQAL